MFHTDAKIKCSPFWVLCGLDETANYYLLIYPSLIVIVNAITFWPTW